MRGNQVLDGLDVLPRDAALLAEELAQLLEDAPSLRRVRAFVVEVYGLFERSQTEATAWRRNVRAAISDLLPILEYVGLDVLVSASYDVTPDRQPILGPLPGHDGLHVAAGFSGHGFMIAPAVGRIVAGGVAGERDTVLDILDSRRFQEGRTVPEPQVI